MWLIGVVVCLLAANHGSNCSLMRAMDGSIVRCGIISSAATSEIVKHFWSRTHVRSAITRIATFTFTNFNIGGKWRPKSVNKRLTDLADAEASWFTKAGGQEAAIFLWTAANI